jgi:DNA-binding transcriptional MerR regulator
MDLSTHGMAMNSAARSGNELILFESTADVFDRDKEHLSITEVCRKYAVTPRTLRFYEARKLVAPLRQGTARLFRAEDCRRIALILKVKAFGFTLGEIARMLSAGEAEGAPHAIALTREKCLEQIEWLQNQRAGIDAAILELQSLVEK